MFRTPLGPIGAGVLAESIRYRFFLNEEVATACLEIAIYDKFMIIYIYIYDLYINVIHYFWQREHFKLRGVSISDMLCSIVKCCVCMISLPGMIIAFVIGNEKTCWYWTLEWYCWCFINITNVYRSLYCQSQPYCVMILFITYDFILSTVLANMHCW